MIVWLQFAVCAAAILVAGSQLSRFGELLADKSGLSKNWAGLVLLAITASSSQLIASIAAVAFHDLPDMAVGALMGSCMFNMLVLGMLDVFSKNKPVSNMVHHGHILSAGFAIILLGCAAIDILFGKNLPTLPVLSHMDPITIGFVPVYFIAMRLTFKYEQTRLQEFEETDSHHVAEAAKLSWARLWCGFGLCALVVISMSGFLPSLAENIRLQTGWGQSFIGLSFIAITTCLPEIAVSTSAARRGSFDVAVASLLGSNLCYMVILAIADFCFIKGPLLRHVSSSNALAAMTAIVSMAIVIIALTYRAEKKFWFIAGDAVALICVYVFANVLLFLAR
jgi:cation:H+ antiporter